jgi:hypothetical protein
MLVELQRPGILTSLAFPSHLLPVEEYELTVGMRPLVGGLALHSPVDFQVLNVCRLVQVLEPIVLTMQNSTGQAQQLRAMLTVEDAPDPFDFYVHPGPGFGRD